MMPHDAALPAGEDATFLDLFGLLTRRWRTIARAVAGGVIVAVLLWVVMPSKYTSTTTFIPEVSSSLQVPSGLASLAGELGFGLGGGSTVSPRFFADVLTSQALENRTLLTRFHRPDGAPGDSATLLELLKVDGDNPLDSLEQGRKVLDDMISTDVDAETTIITAKVTSKDRQLSADLANTMMAYLDEFNTTQRRTSAGEQRRFVEARLSQSADELRDAELRMKAFLQANRTWQQSPQLMFEQGELQRKVDITQDVYLTLTREYEKARIDEFNDTPALTIIDHAAPAQERASPKMSLLGLLGVVLGGVAGVSWVLVHEFVLRLRDSDPALYAGLTARWPLSRLFPR